MQQKSRRRGLFGQDHADPRLGAVAVVEAAALQLGQPKQIGTRQPVIGGLAQPGQSHATQLFAIAGNRHRGGVGVDAKRHLVDDDRPIEMFGALAEFIGDRDGAAGSPEAEA